MKRIPRSGRRDTVSAGSQQARASQHNRNSTASDPQANIARYTALAVNAAAAGDHVQAESYYQHAEHYRKVMKGMSD